MSMDIIGKRIAELRKKHDVKQEALGRYVGVSAQAVSKWEKGGVPEADVLVKIADFFGVSVDYILGRTGVSVGDVHDSLIASITEAPVKDRIRLIFEYCWDMERALVADGREIQGGSIEEFGASIGVVNQFHSCYSSDHGFTRMGVANRSCYFFIAPEMEDKDAAYLDGMDYPAFFRDISDKAVFDVCIMLHKRENKKVFTPQLLVNELGMKAEKAEEVLAVLIKYGLVRATELDPNSEVSAVYRFIPSPSFVALLIFAREIVSPSNQHAYRANLRKKPYLK